MLVTLAISTRLKLLSQKENRAQIIAQQYMLKQRLAFEVTVSFKALIRPYRAHLLREQCHEQPINQSDLAMPGGDINSIETQKMTLAYPWLHRIPKEPELSLLKGAIQSLDLKLARVLIYARATVTIYPRQSIESFILHYPRYLPVH